MVRDRLAYAFGLILPTLLLSVALVTTPGCLSMGRAFETNNIKSLTIGQTTQSDIRRKFGEPYRTGVDSGDTTWTYLNYYFSVWGTQRTTDLYIRFNSDGTVKSYAFNTNVPDQQPH